MRRRGFVAGALATAATTCATARADAAEPTGIDAHAHVFVRGLAPAPLAQYEPDHDAAWQTLIELAGRNGVGRAVLLQPPFLGFDNTYLFEALRGQPDRFRGIPWISPSVTVTADDWETLARIGVHGLRFPIQGLPTPEWSYYEAMLAEALKRDWPIHLQAESKRLPDLLPLLLDRGHKMVVPHFGSFDRTQGPLRDAGFKALLDSTKSGRVWVVMGGAYRVGAERARAAAPLLLDAFGPQRLMWGSDWPHTDTGLNRITTYAETLRWLAAWVPDEATRRTILVDTASRLYGF